MNSDTLFFVAFWASIRTARSWKPKLEITATGRVENCAEALAAQAAVEKWRVRRVLSPMV